jgi:hypothetical protein
VSRTTSLLVVVALTVCAGCASMFEDYERTLAAAGFQMKFARTPEQMARLEALPQRTLTPTPGPDGKNRFVYADAKYCKCIYVGTEAAYDRYQKLEIKKRIAESEEAASVEWGVWGVWGPWY